MKDKVLLLGNEEAIKLFSMREILLLLFYIAYVIDYSCFKYVASGLILKAYVKMSIARRQCAWVDTKNYSTHQRLNEEYPDKNSRIWFEKWLVGVTDGDGSFSIVRQNDRWNLAFKISQSRYNLRLLYYIKKELGVGSITTDKTKAQFFIRDRKKLHDIIFPIFDKYSLLTSKMFNYERFRQAYFILEDASLTKNEKDLKLFELKNSILPDNYISPAWSKANLPLKSINDLNNVMTKPWLVGFIEAEGSFYLVKKAEDRMTHGFGLTQKLDKIVLEAIGFNLHIATKVKYKSNQGAPGGANYYILDTTNSRAIENIIDFFRNTMKGMKAVEYRIWCRSYVKHKGNYAKLEKVRNIIRKLRTNLQKVEQ
nr:hypothetical protein [Ceratocystis fimbriata]WPM94781.1 hypothetical protein [Ceratocystis fimbriata]